MLNFDFYYYDTSFILTLKAINSVETSQKNKNIDDDISTVKKNVQSSIIQCTC